MKTNVLIVCFCAFFLCTDARGETQKQLAFQSGKATLYGREQHSTTKFKVVDIGFVVDMGSLSLEFFSGQEFCLVPGKNPEDIADPSQYHYTKHNKSPFFYSEYDYEKGCTLLARTGNRYAGIKPTKFLPRWNSKEEIPADLLRREPDHVSTFLTYLKGMEYKWGYWPNVPQNPITIERDGVAYNNKTCHTELGKKFFLPGMDYMAYWWEAADTADGCILKRQFGSQTTDGTAVFSSTDRIDALGKSGTFVGGWINLTKFENGQVTYALKLPVVTDEEKQRVLAEEKVRNQAEDLRKEAGVKIAAISNTRKFTLAGAGVRLWWDVSDDNTLSLNYEVAISSAGTLEFAASRKSELADVDAEDIASLNFKQLTGKPIAFPTGRIGVFKTSKGCAAVKPTKVENGGKVVRDSETKVTKMVTFETRIGLETEPKRATQQVTQR